MRGVRGLIAVLGALAVTLAVLLLGAPAALAGGPTSVLLVSPESAESAALYYADEEYTELTRLLGEPDSGTREQPPGLDLMSGGPQLNVTWLLHDVSPWRLDRVFPDTPHSKEVWIHTATHVPDSLNGYWHRAQHPAQLRALLKKLGVMGKPSPKGAGAMFPAPWDSGSPEAAAPPADTAAAQQSRAANAGTADEGTDWWWAIPGLAAGAVLALVLRPFVAGIPGARRPLERWRQRGGQEEPRQELRDV
ncbi:hypothetical protein [Streptomyces sp. NPDC058371]|uniref:hypothetical protein n=1 Tax=Streptomyces sp. NPDC058371 TaxID=3346463 RepID=UPI003659B965